MLDLFDRRERRRLGNRDSPSCAEGQSKVALSLDVRRWAEFEAVEGGFCQGHRKGFADRLSPAVLRSLLWEMAAKGEPGVCLP
jgi:hypothetical protein